jgi:ATP-dependent Lon protease
MLRGTDAVPAMLPLLPLKDIVVFPQMILPVFVSEDVCLRAIEAALEKDKLLFLSAFCADKPTENKSSEFKSSEFKSYDELKCSFEAPYDVYEIGTVAMVMKTRRLPDGRTKVLIQGMYRAQAKQLISNQAYPSVKIAACPDLLDNFSSLSDTELLQTAQVALEKAISLGRNISPDILILSQDIQDTGKVADLIVSNLNLEIVDAQKILGTLQKSQRLGRVINLLGKEIEAGQTQNTQILQGRLQKEDKSNIFVEQKSKENYQQSKNKEEPIKPGREQFLREQMRAIKSELGELEGKDEIDDLRTKIQTSGMNEEANLECLKQLKRLERMNQESSEATITRTYIECLCDLPWNVLSATEVNLANCRKILDEEHYGLEKIKERMLEYVAVRKLNPNLRGPVLCFVGAPGVGKTSLGKSIAKSLGRKFVRISLGGVRDEAEVRGHRRTYVGAQPGRVIQAIKTSGVRNPVVMLDEIDKLASDYKGDPASALLEVLDPEQNHSFSDHYVAVPFDLSQVIFLANANRLDTIPAPLRDRLEIIEVSGYSEEEKMEIARQYIVPKTLEQNGLNSSLVSIQDSSLQLVINRYTRESGLRSLQKQISTISRKLAKNIAESDELGKERKHVKITPKTAKELLGEERYFSDDHDVHVKKVGVATGLAYTSAGGDVLELEVNLFPGKGLLILTGQLGDVMKESVQTALSYVKFRHKDFQIPENKFNEFDIHLHIPAGAVPKDGPSAGVTITLALISAFSGRALRQDVAMTGEISLQGKVLPVGGLREKILAALRVGIKTVFIPEKNKGALMELPVSLKKKIEILFAKNIDDILPVIFSNSAHELSVEKLRSEEVEGRLGALRTPTNEELVGDSENAVA